MASSLVSSSSSPSTASSIGSTPSLLYPPNPSLSPTQPPGSILLNRNEVPRLSTPPGGEKGSSASKAFASIRSSFTWKEDAGPRPPAALINTRARHSSISSNASSASVQSASSSSPGKPTSPQIRFAPLPTPPNLQRTRSITLGVAARSNLLRTQGGAAQGMGMGGPGPRPGGGKVVMTDAEWAEYTRQYEEDQPPDLHHLLRDGTKKLWKKARSLSSSSNGSSSNSNASPGPRVQGQLVTASDTDLPAAGQRGRSSSAGAASSAGVPRSRSTPAGAPAASPAFTPETIPEDAVMEDEGSSQWGESEIGSIKEEDEDAELDDASASGSGSGFGTASNKDFDDDEEDDGAETPLPEYLRKDLGAERAHFRHEYDRAHSHDQLGLAVDGPDKKAALNRARDQEVEHETLRRHLNGLNLHGAGGLGGDGDATPRGRNSPPRH